MLSLLFALTQFARAAEPLETVDVDLDRYMGKWYEIARFEHGFERNCEAVTATYARRGDGKVDVTNRCRKRSIDGKESVATGIARRPDPAVTGHLEVSFFRPFWGQYDVIGLDPEYDWAVVGAPDRKYLWILSRDEHMTSADYETALSIAMAKGFNTGELRMTAQP